MKHVLPEWNWDVACCEQGGFYVKTAHTIMQLPMDKESATVIQQHGWGAHLKLYCWYWYDLNMLHHDS